MTFLKLIRILILRNIRQDKLLTLLSVIGIALGIGLFVGVKAASDRAIASFEADIRGLNSYANYEILDVSGIDFDEKVYRDVRAMEENSLPVIKTFGYCPALKETIDISGVYSVRAKRFFKASVLQKIDAENFYRSLNGVLVTKEFAARHLLKKGDTFHSLVYDREYALKIVDILDSDALLTNTVIMDIGNFQEYFDKTGYLSKIDLVSDERTTEKIRRKLPDNLRIEKKAAIFRNQKALVASFRYNLQFVSLIAILVGIFLLYNTVFMAVVKRRTEIGILRALGADKKTVVLLFTVQGMLLGMMGSILGIAFGQLVAYFSVIAVEKTISSMYSMIAISDYAITRSDAVMALLLGLFVSLLASAIPAFEASRIRPNESSREGSFEGRYRPYYKRFFLAGLFSILSGLLAAYLDYLYTPFAFPVLAYIGILFIIAGATFIAPLYLSVILYAIRKPAIKLFKSTGTITLGDMKGNGYRFSVALMSVAISSALIVALLTLIFSFRDSLNGWVYKNITADVYIKPASCKSNYCFYPLSEEVTEKVKSYPEVAGVDKFRGMQLDLFGRKVVAGFADIEIKRKYLQRKYADTEYEKRLQEMEGSDQVAGISDYLSMRYGLKKGDKIELQSPMGKVTFRINDIFSNYATTAGFIYIDRKWLKKYWGLDDATQLSVYLKDKSDSDQFIHKLRAGLPGYSLEIMNNQELRDKIFDIFHKTFSITYAIEFISILVSLIGVINALLALVLERGREISIVRYMGGSWKQIRQSIVLSSGIVSITGIVLGALLGPLMSVILIRVVNKISFGWEIQLKIPVVSLAVVTSVLFITTLLAGLIPSKIAQKTDPRKFVSFE